MTKQTPLFEEHKRLHARLVDFAGWMMPVQYTGVIPEHLAVRAHAGLFDVSHMGEFELSGPDATANLQRLTVNDVSQLADGQAQCSMFCNERGGVVDDIIVYRMRDDRYMIVVNASNIEKDWRWVSSHLQGKVEASDRSDAYALIALQGPRSEEILSEISSCRLSRIDSFHFAHAQV